MSGADAFGDAFFYLAFDFRDWDRWQQLELEALAQHRQAGDLFYVCVELEHWGLRAANVGNFEGAQGYLEEAMEIAEEAASNWQLTSEWYCLALVLLLRGEPSTAMHWAKKALSARRGGTSIVTTTVSIWIVACSASCTGDFERGAQLMGAHRTIDELVPSRPGNE